MGKARAGGSFEVEQLIQNDKIHAQINANSNRTHGQFLVNPKTESIQRKFLSVDGGEMHGALGFSPAKVTIRRNEDGDSDDIGFIEIGRTSKKDSGVVIISAQSGVTDALTFIDDPAAQRHTFFLQAAVGHTITLNNLGNIITPGDADYLLISGNIILVQYDDAVHKWRFVFSSGAQGIDGIPGVPGVQGMDGMPGIPGPAGNRGPTGFAGLDATSSFSALAIAGLERLSLGVANALERITNTVASAITRITSTVAAGILRLTDTVISGIMRITDRVILGIDRITDRVILGIDRITDTVISGINRITSTVVSGILRLTSTVVESIVRITDTVILGINRITSRVALGIEKIGFLVAIGLERLTELVALGLTQITATVAAAIVRITDTVAASIVLITQTLVDNINGIFTAAGALAASFTTQLRTSLDVIYASISGITSAVSAGITSALLVGGDIANSILSSFGSFATDLSLSATGTLAAVLTRISNFITGGMSSMVSFPLNFPEDNVGNLGAVSYPINFSENDRHAKRITLTGNVTFAFTNPPANRTAYCNLILVQNGTGGHRITLPSDCVNRAIVENGLSSEGNQTTGIVIKYSFGIFYAFLETGNVAGGGGASSFAGISGVASLSQIPSIPITRLIEVSANANHVLIAGGSVPNYWGTLANVAGLLPVAKLANLSPSRIALVGTTGKLTTSSTFPQTILDPLLGYSSSIRIHNRLNTLETGGSGVSSLDDLSDVTILSGLRTGYILKRSLNAWVSGALVVSDLPTIPLSKLTALSPSRIALTNTTGELTASSLFPATILDPLLGYVPATGRIENRLNALETAAPGTGGSGGADTALSNLRDTAISVALLPARSGGADDDERVGSLSYPWNRIYGKSVYVDEVHQISSSSGILIGGNSEKVGFFGRAPQAKITTAHPLLTNLLDVAATTFRVNEIVGILQHYGLMED